MDALGKLGLNLGLFLAYLINVILLLFLLRAVAYKPIIRMLETRRSRIADGIENARKAEQALASAEADKQALLDEARAEAGRIISEARASADDQAKHILATANEDARRIISKAEEAARTEQEQALADLREHIASLSVAAAGHLVGSKLNDKQAHAAVKDFFSSLPAEAKALNGPATVITALPLTADEKAKFSSELASQSLTFVVDPSILGGVIVRSGGREVDASFAHQLNQMRSTLLS